MKKQHQFLSVITLALSSALVNATPVAPDAGQTSRELDKQTTINPPKAVAPLHNEQVSQVPVDDRANVKLVVKAIRVSGNHLFSTSTLEALVTSLSGGEHTFAELDEGVARITAYYRERGYVVARAYLPAQDIQDGVVQVAVLEGLVGAVNIKNQSRVSDQVGLAHLGKTIPGAALHSNTVDRAVLLLSDMPGVGGIRAALQPGASVGTTDLLIELDPGQAYSGNVEIDNYGNRYTGVNRIGAALALNSPLKQGDQLTLRALTSNAGMTYARVAYQLPFGGDGLKVGAAYSDTHYKLVQEFAALQAHGIADSASLYATYPLVRTQQSNVSATLSFERKKLVDYTDAPASAIDKNIQVINAGMAGRYQDSRMGGGMTAFDLSLVSGSLDMDAASQATDATTARSDGAFTRLTYSLSRLQHLTDKYTLSLAFSGQQASKNLNSSEKFSLGGAGGVRAYPQGEGIGDNGWMANVELRRAWSDSLQWVLFYDAGSVTINRNAYAATTNTRTIAGAGVGLNAQYKTMQFRTYIAWRSDGGLALSDPATMDINPRLWVQLSGTF